MFFFPFTNFKSPSRAVSDDAAFTTAAAVIDAVVVVDVERGGGWIFFTWAHLGHVPRNHARPTVWSASLHRHQYPLVTP